MNQPNLDIELGSWRHAPHMPPSPKRLITSVPKEDLTWFINGIGLG